MYIQTDVAIECCDMCEVSEWGQYIVIDKFKIQ